MKTNVYRTRKNLSVPLGESERTNVNKCSGLQKCFGNGKREQLFSLLRAGKIDPGVGVLWSLAGALVAMKLKTSSLRPKRGISEANRLFSANQAFGRTTILE